MAQVGIQTKTSEGYKKITRVLNYKRKNVRLINVIMQKSCSHLMGCIYAVKGIKEVAESKGFDLAFHEMSSEDDICFLVKSCSKVLILGFSENWIRSMTERFTVVGIHPVLVSVSSLMPAINVSCISQDRKSVITKSVSCLRQAGRNKIALVGINPMAFSDIQRKEAFINCIEPDYKKRSSVNLPVSHVFESKGSISQCCDHFLKQCGKYDSAICANDLVGIILIKKSSDKGVIIPDDLYVIGYGNNALGLYTKPGLTTFEPDYYEAGRNAVAIYNILDESPKIGSINTEIESHMIERGSTKGLKEAISDNININKYAGLYNNDRLQFANDIDVKELLKIETFFNKCDEIDRQILDGCLKGKTMEEITMDIPIGFSTFRYRLNKFYKYFNTASKDELCLLLKRYGITNLC